MRKWNVIGFKNVNYKSKRTGNQVEGYNLFLTSDQDSDHGTGEECREVFISRKSCFYSPTLGDSVQLIYNERGFVEDVTSVY